MGVEIQNIPLTFNNCHTPLHLMKVPFKDALRRNCISLTVHSGLSVGGHTSNGPDKELSSFIQLRSTQSAQFNAVAKHKGTIGIGTRVEKRIVKGIKEGIQASGEHYMPFATGVLSDLGIIKEGATDSRFKSYLKSASAWGFAPWQEFVQGDYYFREMLMRLKVKNNDTVGVNRMRVLEHTNKCEVAVVEESRKMDLPAREPEVELEKHFQRVPRVQGTGFVTPGFWLHQIKAG